MKLQIYASKTMNKSLKKERTSEAVQCYLMISTQLIGFLVLTIYPIIWTFRWAWYSYSGIPSLTKYVGWENFITMFTTDFTYWKTWGNTLLFALCKIPIEITLAMFLALLLNRKIKGSNFFRSMYYMPSVISVAIIGLVFSNLFNYWGWINGILVKLGLISSGIDWFATKQTAMAVLVIGSIWNTFGINVMYFLAALTNVPEELYECAKLDGASKSKTFFKITLPMIAPVFQIIMLLSTLGTLGVNEYILVLTNGGPSGQTFSVMSYLTKQFMPGFAESSTPALGYGCAMSLVTTVIFAFVAIVYSKFSKKMGSLY